MNLSIVIPAGPGEQAWRALLRDLAPLRDGAEIVAVAVEGDIPPAFAAADYGLRVPVRWIEAAAGRARQLNAGAGAARGARLVFLHADSRLRPNAVGTLQATPLQSDTVYFFDLRFHDGPALMTLNRLGVHVRSRGLRLPFGDQGLTMPRALFERLGGFDPTLSCGEDHDLVWRARRAGARVRPLGATLSTSARRYAERGWWRTTARHLWLTVRQARAFARRRPPA